MPDNDIVSLIQKGDNQALDYILSKYNNIVNIKASKFFAAGIERDDIINILKKLGYEVVEDLKDLDNLIEKTLRDEYPLYYKLLIINSP